MNSPSASIVVTLAGADCSSCAYSSTRSLRHPLAIGLRALAPKHKTTSCSGHCTQAATPLYVKSCEYQIREFGYPVDLHPSIAASLRVLEDPAAMPLSGTTGATPNYVAGLQRLFVRGGLTSTYIAAF